MPKKKIGDPRCRIFRRADGRITWWTWDYAVIIRQHNEWLYKHREWPYNTPFRLH